MPAGKQLLIFDYDDTLVFQGDNRKLQTLLKDVTDRLQDRLQEIKTAPEQQIHDLVRQAKLLHFYQEGVQILREAAAAAFRQGGWSERLKADVEGNLNVAAVFRLGLGAQDKGLIKFVYR